MRQMKRIQNQKIRNDSRYEVRYWYQHIKNIMKYKYYAQDRSMCKIQCYDTNYNTILNKDQYTSYNITLNIDSYTGYNAIIQAIILRSIYRSIIQAIILCST